MKAEQLLKLGDLEGALASLQEDIRKTPTDIRLRVFLFQLLCILGRWERAIIQLKACATLDPYMSEMAHMYRTAIICEIHREKVFRSEQQPLVFGEPAEWIASMIEALRLQVDGNHRAARDLRERAFDAASTVSGTLNASGFSWVADADPRLGPLLEIIVNGRYFWAPFTAFSRITMHPPADLRDKVWMPATVTWSNSGEAVVLIPTRYAGTNDAAGNQHRLAQATDWLDAGTDITAGVGQRVLATDSEDCALMDLRELTIGGAEKIAGHAETAIAYHG